MSADAGGVMSPDDRRLYVISCRKAAPGVDVHAEGARITFATPKRAGTYVLLQGELRADIREQDLYRVDDADTDAGDFQKGARGRNAHVDWHERQGEIEASIARRLQALGKPLVLYVHGFNTK